jgi:tRNA A37 threonylcarbamoyladenosine synthetase subunit TsaC/SUA5/YrdC
VAALFGAGVGLVLDGGPCVAPPSTVIDATGPHWRVLRDGTLGLADIEAAARR